MIRFTRLIALAALTAALFSQALAQGAAEQRLINVDDLLELDRVGDPTISPDGEWVAYTVESANLDKDELSTQIYMVSTDGAETVQLTADEYSASSPQWSPDDRYLGFIAARGEDDEARPQVWLLDRRGGDARQYTSVDQGVAGYSWSPDGQRMLLMIRDKTATDIAEEAAEAAGEEAKPLPYVIDRLQFKQDGVPYLDRSRTHIYVWDGRVEEPPLQLTYGDYDDSQAVWSPDSKEIAFSSNRSEEPDGSDNSDIWVVSADGDGSAREPRRITSNVGGDRSPAWSNDGRFIAYVTVTEPDLIWYATNHLAIASAAGGSERVLTAALDRNVQTPVFSPDDAQIYFSLEDSGEQHLASFELESGVVNRPVEGRLSVGNFVMHDSGDIVLGISRPHLPTELFLLADSTLSQLTHTNEDLLDDLTLAAIRNVTFPSSDGVEVEAFIFTPPGYEEGRQYPTILRLHGGPVAQFDFSFNAEAQLLAANGYVVLTSNPRGSSGYGQDFSAALFANWGVPDFEDVIAAVDYAIDEGYSDETRLGVGGWSYGGILTNYVITKSNRFAAAISGASEVNYLGNYGHDHYQYQWEKELGLPWETKEAWEKISPWENVDKIETPTLVMGGKEDWNVPVQNSEQLYQALKRRGIDTQLIVYPDESHGISRPSFRKDRWERYLGWYDRYLLGQ